MPVVLNMPKFWMRQISESGRVLNMPALHSVLNMPECALLDSVVNICWVLNVPYSEQETVTQGSKYVTIWLNMSELDVNMPEDVWIYDNKQSSEYVSYST